MEFEVKVGDRVNAINPYARHMFTGDVIQVRYEYGTDKVYAIRAEHDGVVYVIPADCVHCVVGNWGATQ